MFETFEGMFKFNEINKLLSKHLIQCTKSTFARLVYVKNSGF